MSDPLNQTETRQLILRAALKQFAHSGYAAASVQQIVDEARVSKPALYYYFADKARLYEALVTQAHDDRYAVMKAAVARAGNLFSQLVEILAGLFEYAQQNRELTRLSLATAFAGPGEVPEGLGYKEKCERNFGFVKSLFEKAKADGLLDSRFDVEELANGFYGQLLFYVASHLIDPDWSLDRPLAERVVNLFFSGAGAKSESHRPGGIEASNHRMELKT